MILRQVHAWLAWALVATIVAQVFLAGTAMANLGGSGDFSTHIEFGYTVVGIASLALVLSAIAARRGRREVGIAAGLLVLYVVQTVLPSARSAYPILAALHPLNAMLLFGLAIWYARRAWTARTSGPAGPGGA
ncbi:MAG: hypothetical protein EPO36_03685 [Chloroflexota bacterium]|nr:MAG: hypothetical protein EPO36_03685 [Chloroflexota bacterium]